jgi:hypothetical protein
VKIGKVDAWHECYTQQHTVQDGWCVDRLESIGSDISDARCWSFNTRAVGKPMAGTEKPLGTLVLVEITIQENRSLSLFEYINSAACFHSGILFIVLPLACFIPREWGQDRIPRAFPPSAVKCPAQVWVQYCSQIL